MIYAKIVFFLSMCFMQLINSSLVEEKNWVAVFWDENSKNICNFFYRDILPSGNQKYCEHSTVEFDPSPENMNIWSKSFGSYNNYTIVGLAIDSHAQALLLHHIESSSNARVISKNSFPHTTISAEDIDPYTPVYSNFLWQRLYDSNILQKISIDEHRKPTDFQLPEKLSQWNDTLPSATYGTVSYGESAVFVRRMRDIDVTLSVYYKENSNFWGTINYPQLSHSDTHVDKVSIDIYFS